VTQHLRVHLYDIPWIAYDLIIAVLQLFGWLVYSYSFYSDLSEIFCLRVIVMCEITASVSDNKLILLFSSYIKHVILLDRFRGKVHCVRCIVVCAGTG